MMYDVYNPIVPAYFVGLQPLFLLVNEEAHDEKGYMIIATQKRRQKINQDCIDDVCPIVSRISTFLTGGWDSLR